MSTRRTRSSIVVMLVIALFGAVPGLLMWGVQMAWIPFWAAGVVNGLGHYRGYRNFDCADASTNLFPIGILIGGEELHNNHHAFATSARLSNRWYEFDIGWMYIRLLALLGLARVKRLAPVTRIGAPRAVIDGATLEALINNRYDVLARYGRSLKKLYREELVKLQDQASYKGLKRWLVADAGHIPDDWRQRLDGLLARSQKLATFYAMREELRQRWGRRGVTCCVPPRANRASPNARCTPGLGPTSTGARCWRAGVT